MNESSRSAEELRKTFDHNFAQVPSNTETNNEDLLTIRIAGNPYALCVSEITGIATDRKIVAVPTLVPELLGICGIRGTMMPVYHLAMLLGFSANSERTRWFALFGPTDPVALAFSDFGRYVRIPRTQVIPGKDDTTHIKGLAQVGGVMHPVISISSVEEAIKQGAGGARLPKEN